MCEWGSQPGAVAGANGHRTQERKIRGETLHGGFPRVVFDATLLRFERTARPCARPFSLPGAVPGPTGHVDVVRALALARRTDRLNPVHVLHSRRDVRVRERDRRALRVRHVLQQHVLSQSGASPEYPVAGYLAAVQGRPAQHDMIVPVHHRREVLRRRRRFRGRGLRHRGGRPAGQRLFVAPVVGESRPAP